MVGERLLWKNAQKKEKKKSTSDVINRIIPHRIPLATIDVWSPWKVLSRLMSRHHWMHVIIRIAEPSRNRFMLNSLNHFVIPDVKVIAAIAPVRGQGLWSTIWKECSFLIIISEM
jgi:hypothetical protein